MIVGYLQPTYIEKLLSGYSLLQSLFQHYCRRDSGTDIDPDSWNRLKIPISKVIPGPTLFLASGDPAAESVPAKNWQQYAIITPKFNGPYVLGFLWRNSDQQIIGAKLCVAILKGGPTAMRIGPGPLETWGHHVNEDLAASELAIPLQPNEIIHYVGRLPEIAAVLNTSTII